MILRKASGSTSTIGPRPLCPVSIKVVRGQENLETQLSYIPFRHATLRELEAVGPGDITLTPVYKNMTAALARNLGEFSAGRFFCLPGTLDTAAMVTITSHVGSFPYMVRDEAPMVRCALLGELVMVASNVKKLTQLQTRFGPSLRLDSVKRKVIGPGAGVPARKIGCVDLGTYTRILGGSFVLQAEYEDLCPGTYGSGTAVVPITYNGLGLQMGYPLSPLKDRRTFPFLTTPYASLNYISGDYNILIVLIDTEHKQARARDFDIGRCGVRVPVIGHTLRNFGIRLPGVRDLVDVFLGLPGEDVAPGDKCTSVTEGVKKRLKLSQQRERWLKTRVASLSEIVDDLRQKQLVSEDACKMLEKCFTEVPLEVMQRILKQSSDGEETARQSEKYSPTLHMFALTLQFYSTKAYNYVRETFDCALPHPSTITKWYSTVNGEPGFTVEAINAIRVKANEAKKNQKELLCSLVVDEMAIRKHVEWDGRKFRGYVDIGTEMDDDSSDVETEAMVFMVVSLDSHWKIPCGYFLINGNDWKRKSKRCEAMLDKTCQSRSSHSVTDLRMG
ncbi:hypothetical protein MRX96_028916 [Rhipicephalus microplus]